MDRRVHDHVSATIDVMAGIVTVYIKHT